jgi:hypothetical protein
MYLTNPKGVWHLKKARHPEKQAQKKNKGSGQRNTEIISQYLPMKIFEHF